MELSGYFMTLDEVHGGRYVEKISVVGIDPYCLRQEDLVTELAIFPKIMYPDIVNYLIYKTSAYTLNALKAYKGLEVYNQAVCGWVTYIGVKHFGENALVLAKVKNNYILVY